METTKSCPFLTTSSVLKKINASLQQEMKDTTARFELQTRLPDGSARPAEAGEILAIDFQNKLQQSASLVNILPNPQKLEWAEKQRHEGNSLFSSKKYEEAIDVYLTCLTVAAAKPTNDQLTALFTKTMNNLALTTLSLQWYRKTLIFCNLAIEHLNETDQLHKESNALQLSKLYFKRSKAYRLTGEFDCATEDLSLASSCFNELDDVEEFTAACKKESALLQRAIAAAQDNHSKQQRAMKQFLGSAPSHNPKHREEALYTPNNNSAGGRSYSSIRAPEPKAAYAAEPLQLSYWQQYMQRVGIQAQKVLDWLDEREDRRKEA